MGTKHWSLVSQGATVLDSLCCPCARLMHGLSLSGSLLSWSLLAALMEHNKQQGFISLEAAKSKV